jgi:hypothetical protein
MSTGSFNDFNKKGNHIFGMNDWFDLTKDNFVPYLF